MSLDWPPRIFHLWLFRCGLGNLLIRINDLACITTGLSISGALKKGLVMLRQKVYRQSQRVPYQVYKEMNLGPGGYAIVPSTRTRRGVQEAIRRKHQR